MKIDNEPKLLKKQLSLLMLAVIASLMTVKLFAAEQLMLDESKRYKVQVAESCLNRLRVMDERIAQVFGLGEYWHLEYDDIHGQIFLKPQSKETQAQAITLVTESGCSQDLTLLPSDKEATTVLLLKKIKPSSLKANAFIPALTAATTAPKPMALLEALKNQQMVGDFVESKKAKEITLHGLKLKRIFHMHNATIDAEVFEMRNLTRRTIQMQKAWFQKPHILDYQVSSLSIAPQNRAKLWITSLKEKAHEKS